MAVTPDLVRNPFAVNGAKGTAPAQSAPDGMINFNDGYTTAYEMALDKGNPLARPVTRQSQNYLFNQMSMTTKAWQQMTFAPWYSGMPNGYEIGAHVYATDAQGGVSIFRSTVVNNVSDPKNLTGWELVPLPSAMWANIPMPSGGVLGASRFITAGVDLRTLTRGTYVITNDARAAQCSNIPIAAGETVPRAGIYEVMDGTGATGTDNVNYRTVRYTDRLGNSFDAGMLLGSWSVWRQNVKVDDFQRGIFNYANATSASPIIVNTSPAFTPVNGSIVRWRSPGQTPNAVQANVNGQGLRNVLGPDLQTLKNGAILPNQHVVMEFDTSLNSWIVTSQTARPQVTDAIDDQQAPNLGQVKQLLAQLGATDWADITNKPRVMIWADPLTWALATATRMIRILWGGGGSTASPDLPESSNQAWAFVAENSVEFPNEAGDRLRINNRAGAAILSLGRTAAQNGSTVQMNIRAEGQLEARNGLVIMRGANRASITFWASNGGQSWFIDNLENGNLEFSRGAVKALVFEAGGRATLSQRPLFGTQIPYDSGNLGIAGAVVPFGGLHNQPGWLYCDGAAYSQTLYPELYAVIGNTYGAAPSGQFRVPNMKGYFPRGWSDGTASDPGRELGSYQSWALGSHSHTGSASFASDHTHSVNLVTQIAGGHTHSASTSIQAGGTHTHGINASIVQGGSHQHNGQTSINGEHQHFVKEGSDVPQYIAGQEWLASGDDYTQRAAYNSTTGPAGGHYHSFVTNEAGAHTHGINASIVDGGSHTHNASTSVDAVAGHQHAIAGSTGGAGAHSHTITITATGGTDNRPMNVAFPYYIATGRLGV